MFIRSFTVALLTAAVVAAHAVPVVPSYATFGPFNGTSNNPATYGGVGIPTDPSAVRTFSQDNGNLITLALTAYQRSCSPPLSGKANGKFKATPGKNAVDCAVPAVPEAATFDFGYYLDLGTAKFNDLVGAELFYDLDPAIGNDVSTYGRINLKKKQDLNQSFSIFQGFSNLDFDELNASSDKLGITAPDAAFNRDLSGEYGLLLRVTTEGATHDVSILVNVAAAAVTDIPEPGTWALVGLALVGMGALRRRKR